MKKNILTKSMIMLSVAAFTAGCFVKYPEDAPVTPQRTYGIWQVKDCVISAKRADLTLMSDARLSDEKFLVKIKSDRPLVGIPLVRHTKQPRYVPPVEGSGDSFSFEVPFHPALISRMEDDDGFLVVTYRPKTDKMIKMQAYFETQQLARALTDLHASSCVK